MTRTQALVTLGIMLSLFLAAMEATVVATAMPTIVGQLGGLATYSWVFAAYMLASTVTVPVYGKLSDIYGRRPVHAAAMGLFLFGSLLCGLATSMSQLVAFRAVQGLGAGGVLSLAFIIVGAMFGLEQRARMQGYFASVWAVASIVGPLLGGFLVDRVSWRWVFYINVPFGLVAATLIWTLWKDEAPSRGLAAPVDVLGAGLLTAGMTALLLGLFELEGPAGWPLLGAALVVLAALVPVERRAADPVLPLPLFRDRLFAAACGHGLLSGCALFGSLAFVPLYVQAVLGTSATVAGATLTPLTLGWVLASIVGSRMLLRVSYRALALVGMSLLTLGALQVVRIISAASLPGFIIGLTLMGIGMGLSVPALLIAVQSTVARRMLGTATATVQFSRSVGGVVGVSVMGAVLSLRLAKALAAAGADPAAAGRLLDPMARSSVAAALVGPVRAALGGAVQEVFVIALAAAALGLAVTALAPGGRIATRGRRPPSSTLPEAAPGDTMEGES